jgi:hypothetical protein
LETDDYSTSAYANTYRGATAKGKILGRRFKRPTREAHLHRGTYAAVYHYPGGTVRTYADGRIEYRMEFRIPK